MNEPPIIEHDPDERPKGRRPTYWFTWLMVAFIWSGFLYFHTPDWYSVIVGLGTGLVFAFWSVEVSDNRIMGLPRSKERPRD